MTTGERMVELSTLTTGTAMDHFMNIDCSNSKLSGITAILLEEMSFGIETNQTISLSLEPIKTIELSIDIKITQ